MVASTIYVRTVLLFTIFFGPPLFERNKIARLSSSDAFAQSSDSAEPSGSTSMTSIRQWFATYDDIRRQAQMSPQEKGQADAMMSKGLSMIIPGEEKTQSQALLSSLLGRYEIACARLKRLEYYPETASLHKGYYQYFEDASRLFTDYLKVQGSLFAVDEQTGKPLAGELLERKEALTALEERNKSLDSQLRRQFGIAAYSYKSSNL
jgi:hypothetical protein